MRSHVIKIGTERLAAAAIDQPRHEAELLLSHCLGVKRLALYAEPDTTINADVEQYFFSLIDQRCTRKPAAYLMKSQDFMGLSFYVDEHVLIPRPETELLVEEVLKHLVQRGATEKPLRIVDIGTGSGVIAVALAAYLPQAIITGIDINTEALRVARYNTEQHAFMHRISFVQSKVLDCFRIGSYCDIIVSNPPYICDKDIDSLQREVMHEPHIALRGGEKGLDVINDIIRHASNVLKHNGYLFMEMDPLQKNDIITLLEDHHFNAISVKPDYQGFDRILIARFKE